jgi:hypothetical protein
MIASHRIAARQPLALVGLLAALVLGGGAAAASIPDSSGVIHACYKAAAPDKGTLRVINTESGQACPSGYSSLAWNQSGPQGQGVFLR